MVVGIICLPLVGIAFLPLLGWANWIIIPFAVLGLVLGILGIRSTPGIIAISLCSAAIVIGIFRLTLGGGII